jgi:HD-like signal output (HDOD) protein
LREAVVRLGLKQVGAIVQQIKLVNGMVRPEKNRFDIQRFWQHSVGVAIIADKLYVEKRVLLPEAIPFDHYWIGGLLHDVGKLVMGFFFWDTFAGVLKRMNTPKTPFHWAEVRLGNPITHEQIGQFVLTRAKAESEIVEVVGCHNSIGRRPNGLTCLIHVADNLCKDLGLGYLEKERAVYSPSVLDALQVREEDLEKLKDAVGGPMVDEIEDLVGRCAEEGN